VSASVGERDVVIEVIDDGPGIPPERLHDVVEPFVRLDSSRGGRPGSVGLGLSIVDEIVRGHGGGLILANREPSGLVARVSLPFWFFLLAAAVLLLLLFIPFYSVAASPAGGWLSLRLQRKSPKKAAFSTRHCSLKGQVD
jgi:hypothetical protein